MGRRRRVPKFREFAENWLAGEFHRGSASAPTYQSRLQHLIRFETQKGEKYGFGRRRIDKITTEDVEAWQRAIEAHFRGTTPRTLVALLGRLFKEARRKGFSTCEMPDRKPAVSEAFPGSLAKKAMRPHIAAKFLTGARTLPMPQATWWLILLFTGLRLNEARALHWADLDFDDRPLPSITAAWQVGRDGHRKPTKTKAAHIVPIHPQLDPYVRAWMQASPKKGRWDRVIVDEYGAPPAPKTMVRRLREDLRTLGIAQDHTPHHFRHTFISLVSATDGIQHAWTDRMTHAVNSRKVIERYRHANYEALCREFLKWRIET